MRISAETHWRSRKNIIRKCAHFLSLQHSFLKSLNSQFVVIPETLWRQEKNVCKTMHVSQFIVIWETNEDQEKKSVRTIHILVSNRVFSESLNPQFAFNLENSLQSQTKCH
jgi:hypothetical protein